MNSEYVLKPLQTAFLFGNAPGMRSVLPRLTKQAEEPTCAPVLKTQIYLEMSRAARALGEIDRATRYCDSAISGLSPSAQSLSLLSALKRLRVLLFLDTLDLVSARNLLEEIDGLELALAEGVKSIDRNLSDVTTQTWLLSIEVALSGGICDEAQTYYDRACDSLLAEENNFRSHSRRSPMEIRNQEASFNESRLMLSVYEAAIKIALGESADGVSILRRVKQTASKKNEAARRQAAMQSKPNVPLFSKIRCLLGEWTPELSAAPDGINYSEAARFFRLGKGQTILDSTAVNSIPESIVVAANAAAAAPVEPFPAKIPDESSDRTLIALERIAEGFTRLTELAPQLGNLERQPDGPRSINPSNLYGGHILYFDLDALLFNASTGNLTGYIKFVWQPGHYESEIVLNSLPGSVSSGEAFLFFGEGTVIDATIGSPAPSASPKEAADNFLLIVKLCLDIGLNVSPDIMSEAFAAPAVAKREHFLNIVQKDFIDWLTAVENQVRGYVHENEPEDFNLDAAFAASFEREKSELIAPFTPEDEPIVLTESDSSEVPNILAVTVAATAVDESDEDDNILDV